MRRYNLSVNLVRNIEQLYDKAASTVQMNGSMGKWFKNNSLSKARISSVNIPQHFSRANHVRCLEEHISVCL